MAGTVTIDGVEQVLQLNGAGSASVDPSDGKVLWEHAWKGYPIVQPALTADGDVLLSVRDRGGTRRLAVSRGPGGWTVEEHWTSIALKPYFNDFVVHEGHAYGVDGSLLASIDVADGKRKWKGGRSERIPDEATHWSLRLMAKYAGVTRWQVQQVWQAADLKPHRIKSFKISQDPELAEKVADVVGLYLRPPDNALVLCQGPRMSERSGQDLAQPSGDGVPIRTQLLYKS